MFKTPVSNQIKQEINSPPSPKESNMLNNNLENTITWYMKMFEINIFL